MAKKKPEPKKPEQKKIEPKKQAKPDEVKSAASRMYFNRELSWLEFNDRVLEEAQDRSNPIMERLKFLAITASNLDEFFMIRVSSAYAQLEAGLPADEPSGLSPAEQLSEISKRVHRLTYKQYNCLNRSILPALEKEGIGLTDFHELSPLRREFVTDYFYHTLFPVLTPMAIDKSRPFPFLANKSLNLIVELEQSAEEFYAVVQVPSVVPRFLALPEDKTETEKPSRLFILTEDIIRQFAHILFPGYKVLHSYAFRITRNADLDIDEEEADDILNEIENSIKQRKWGEPVRLEVEKNMMNSLRQFLEVSLEVEDADVYEIMGPLDLTCMFAFSGISGCDQLRFAPSPPQPVVDFLDRDVFEAIREKDIIVNHPYESFDCVVNFIKAAAQDPGVMAIKQTLYRVSGNSPIISALMLAAENGKQVTVLVELKARFDEENNINWAKKLEKSGCHVTYGLVGLKIHCKLCLVVRREEDGIRRYVHLGTGNYNDSTAKIYTDHGYFTCKESFGQDISGLFNVLTGYSKNLSWRKIAVAPVGLREMFIRHIETEAKNAAEGKPARIIAKFNSLVDPVVIEAVYKAAKAGVKIELICRGICCLRPGVEGISENISVVSIVGRYLEHSRIFYFENGGDFKMFLSSADWMQRNLDRRVEIAFPIDEPELKERIFAQLEIMLGDTAKLRVMKPDGSYARVDRRGKEHINSQEYFYEQAVKRYTEARSLPPEDIFRPVLAGSDEDDLL